MSRLALPSRLALLLVVALAAACETGSEVVGPPDERVIGPNGRPLPPNEKPVAVALLTTHDSLFAGTSRALVATVTGGTGPVDVLWSSTAPDVAAVTSNGVVIALVPGTTRIIARADASADTATITVRSPVQQITIEPGLSTIPLNTALQFNAAVNLRPGAGGIPFPLTWTSSNPTVLSISPTGLATAVGIGAATVTVQSHTVVASSSVTVAEPLPTEASVYRIEVDMAPSSVTPGSTAHAYAVVFDSLGNVLSDQDVTWTSSNTAVATVTPTGDITAIAPGTAEIRAARGGKSAGKGLRVNAPTAARVQISVTSPIDVGDDVQASVTVWDDKDKLLHGRPVTWKTGNVSVATITEDGWVSGNAAGTTTVIAMVDNVVAETSLVVLGPEPGEETPAVASVTVALAADSLAAGATTQATAVARDPSGAVIPGTSFSWNSSHTNIATVNASGVVTAVAAGSATITASASGKSGGKSLTVKNTAPAPVASVTVTLSASSLLVGQTAQATATARDASGKVVTGQSVTWSLDSGQSVASVSPTGVVTGVSAGSAVVKATVSGISGTAGVTVASTPPPPGPSGPAQLPQEFVDTSMPSQSGNTITVKAGDNLQNAINNAQPGDVIVLQAGATFTGNFKLPKKTGSGWIVIRTSTPDNQLPPPGTRVTPSHASLMPRIVTNGVGPAVSTAAGAAYYRFIGVEVTAASSVSMLYNLIQVGDGSGGQTQASQVPHHLVFDRVYVHGHPTLNFQRCFALNGAYAAVIDSWVSECHSNQFDSQAIAVWNGPGPFKIVNNHLEGAGMGILLGGAMSMPNLIPRDFEIRRNHFLKPLSWKGVWSVKNALEFKTGERILVEDNVIDGSWLSAQTGFAFVLVSMGAGGQTWHHVGDVTIRSNLIRNVGAGFNIGATYAGASTATSRLTISNNVMDRVNTSATPGEGRLLQVISSAVDITFEHNTFLATTGAIKAALMFDVAPTVRLRIANNIFWRGQYGMFGSGKGEGMPAWSHFAPDGTWANNLMIGSKPSWVTYPATTLWSDLAGVGFVSPSSGDFRLGSTSPYRTAASDGSAVGADVATVMSRLTNVIVP